MAVSLLSKLIFVPGATAASVSAKVAKIATDPGAFFGRAGVTQRLGLAAGYIGASAVFNKIVSNFEERKRNYYGQERYESYYKGGADSLRTASTVLGSVLAFGAVMGKDPISRVLAEGRYTAGRMKLALNKRALAKQQSSLLQNEGELLDITGKLKDSSTYNTTLQLDELMGKIGGRKTLTEKKELLENLLPQTRKEIRKLQVAIRAGEKSVAKLKNQPGITPFYAARMTAYGLFGLGIINSMPGFSESSRTVGAGILAAGALYGVSKLGSAITKAGGWPATAMVAATSYGVYSSTSAITRNMTAEGTITDISMANQSEGVSKMNFSTAGLVLALHNSNRKY